SMSEALSECFAGALVPAERAAETAAGLVSPGDWLGTQDGEVVAVGDDAASVAVDLVARLAAAPHLEIVTIYVGRDAAEADAERIERAVEEAYPQLELDVHRGDQPLYPYLIGLE
ncbi:MAG: hypothetical protein LC722_02020, partial [Actinobacteria bacterium]|nr:hypothetical protein [Actinomycetota bacterium]